MLKSEGSEAKLKLWTRSAGILVLCLIAALLLSSAALAQGTTEFTLQPAPFNPDAVAPGGTSSSNIQVGSVNGFTGSVALSCQVTSPQVTVSTPVCTVSPPSVVPPAGATATITTTDQTTTVGYNVTITGTGATTTYTTPPLGLTVLAVTPQFTITIQRAVAPSSVPAGTGAQGIVTINPINGYSSPCDPNDSKKCGVYLACATISPLVTIPPVCSFSSPNPQVESGIPINSTLTISTFGSTTTCSRAHSRAFYALWLSLPMLSLVGVGAAAGKRSRKALILLALFVLCAGILMTPACGNTTTTTCTPNGVTPANTYTFTIIGVDINGVVSSNTGSTTSAGPSVSLAVTAPTPQ